MNLFTPGLLNWKDTQLLYHALARMGTEGLIIQGTILGWSNSSSDQLNCCSGASRGPMTAPPTKGF